MIAGSSQSFWSVYEEGWCRLREARHIPTLYSLKLDNTRTASIA